MEDEFFAIRRLLDAAGVRYEVLEHRPARTAEEAAAERGSDVSEGVKSLVFKAGSEFILVLVPGDRIADWRKLRQVTGQDSMRLATPEEVLAATNCDVGSVHPFGPLAGLRTYMDKGVLQRSLVVFSAGLATLSVKMRARDLKEAAKPEIVDVVRD